MTIKQLCKKAHATAIKKGFWILNRYKLDDNSIIEQLDDRNDGELIALMHSELSEALEGLRHGNPKSRHIKTFSAIEEEMADVMIRVADFCEAKGLKIEEAIEAKMKFNETRPKKHGKKF